MRVLLVQPNYREQRYKGMWKVNLPLGLCYIASILEKKGIEVKIIDANAEDLDVHQCHDRILQESPNIVGFSMLSPSHEYCKRVIDVLPKHYLKVAGGPHASSYSFELLKEGFDIVVKGEGEQAFVNIINGCRDEIIYGKQLDVDSIPFPARHLLINNGIDLPYSSAGARYRPLSPILTSRGCPYNCYYCNKKVFDYKFRGRSPENVIEELKILKKMGVMEVDIIDDCFNFDLERAKDICKAIIDNDFDFYIRTSNGVRADKVDSEFLQLMKDAGCGYIAYGIESGNQSILDRIPKVETLEQMENVVRMTKATGIKVAGFFMFGLLGDTKETMQETIDFAKSLNFDYVSFGIATPYVGTRFHDIVEKEGTFLSSDFSNIHHTSGKMSFTHPDIAPPEVVEEMYRKAYREFYLRPIYIAKKILNMKSRADFNFNISGLKTIREILR